LYGSVLTIGNASVATADLDTLNRIAAD